MWQLETQDIFEVSYGSLVTSVSKKTSVDQSELEK